METFPAEGSMGRVVAFEIENAYMSRRAISRLLKKADGISDVRLAGRFGSSNDIRVEFKYFGREYVVEEPFGDNSRYWIGPKGQGSVSADINDLEALFGRYRPPLYRSILADVATLRWFRGAPDRRQR